MRNLLTTTILLAGVASDAAVGSILPSSGCAHDNCLWKAYLPNFSQSVARDFCARLVGIPAPTTKILYGVTTTIYTTQTPAATTVTRTATRSVTSYLTTACSASGVTVTPTTTAFYASRAPSASLHQPRAVDAVYNQMLERDSTPSFFTSNCNSEPSLDQLKSACECFLTTPTISVTLTATRTMIDTAVAKTATVTNMVTSFTTIRTCVSTTTPTTTARVSNCGAPESTWTATTQGQTTCAATSLPSPSLSAYLRIEGDDSEGTIFEGCIAAGPRNITTPSGGTHLCDGTNAGANPGPGTVPTDQLDAASKLSGFPYDGEFYPKYSDYLISSISDSAQTDTQYWGILVNGQYTPTGGCQFEVAQGDRTLWAFDAFNAEAFLEIDRDWSVVTVSGGTEKVRVVDAMKGGPVAGAAIEGNPGEVSDHDGYITIHYPQTPGCYKYKAAKAGAIRSNTHYISVLERFDGS